MGKLDFSLNRMDFRSPWASGPAKSGGGKIQIGANVSNYPTYVGKDMKLWAHGPDRARGPGLSTSYQPPTNPCATYLQLLATS